MARDDDRRDSLTDLASRGRLERSLNRRCGRRIGGSIVPSGDTVVLIDVVGLKAVNRSRGFLAGDELILKVARRLVRLSRGVALVGRLGGDEFVAVFRPRHTAMAERFAAALLHPSRSPAVRVASTTIRRGDTARRLIARLDAVLQESRDEPPQSHTRLDDPPPGPE
jgi:diguanylate cyclase (GGDEF)-like protein